MMHLSSNQHCLLLLAMMISCPANSISPVWTGASSTTWSTNANWSTPATAPGGSPSPFDSAIFAGTAVRTTAANTGVVTLDTLQFNAGATVYTITNSGAGNFTLAGAGIVNNSSNTQIFTNSSILNFQNNASAGSNVTLTNNTGGTINFQGNSTANNTNIVNNGTGVINISGLSAGSISIGSLAGAGSVNLGTKLLNVGGLNTSTTISGVISGVGGQLTKVGTGTLTLTGANTYTGDTTISAGTLQIGSGSTTGSLTGNIVNDAALIFNRSNALTYSGIISGTGTMTKLGAGTLTLTGNHTYTGNTTISAGVLDIGNGGTTGSITGNIIDNASLRFNRSDSFTYGGVVSGTGTLTKLGAATLTLTGTNTYTGTTTISAGTLQLGNGGTTGSVAGNIANSGSLIFNRSDAISYGGIISGTGTLTKLGNDSLTFTGANTYTGVTTISAGTLQIGNGGTTGSVASNIVDNSALIFNRSNALSYASVISGTGTVTQSGAGTLTLSGNNTYTGGTFINAGTLAISSDARLGNAAGALTINNAILQTTATMTTARATTLGAGTANFSVNTSTTLTHSGLISGVGQLLKSATGTLILSGDNNYSGGTSITAGILQIGNGGTTGSIIGDIVNNAALRFSRSDALTYADVISGTGTLTKLSAGVLTLTGDQTFTGTTTISAGTLQIGNGGTTGSIVSNIANSAALIFNRADALTYAGVISGTGTLTKLGADMLTLTGANTYTGNTTISAGSLQIGNGGTTGTVAGNIINNASLIFNRSNAVTYAGIISGTGAMTKLGSNTLTLTGANTYTGGTTISDGILQIGSGSTTGSITGNILNNAALIFNRSNTVTYTGVISGTGTVTKAGTGTLTLSGNNTYSGGTLINAGTLVVGSDSNLGNGSVTFNAGTLQTTASFATNKTFILNGTGTFSTNAGTTLTHNGQITGSGQLTKTGTGTMILANTSNNFSGGSLVLGGELQATTETLPGNVQVNGGAFLNFQQNSDGTYNGVISGAGSVRKNGNGTVTLTAIQTYTGQTNINQGALQGTTDAIDNNNVTVAANAGLILNQAINGSYAGLLSGAGSLIKLGAGTVTLSANNTYTGGTFINEGALRVSQNSNLGGAAGPLTINGGILETTASFAMNRLTSIGTNGATFITDALTTLTSNGQMAGTGQLIKNGSGTLILANASNNYSGGTVLNDGTLRAGAAGGLVNNSNYTVNGGILDLNGFSLTMSLLDGTGGEINVNGGSLTINQTADGDFAGLFSGSNTSTITKTNTNTLHLTGNSSAYAGTFTVNNGHLVVDGSLGGTMLVNANGRVSGIGTLGNTTIFGTIAPGNSIGVLTINGNYVQAAGSIYEVEINSQGQSDLINVTGSANLNGGTVYVIKESGFYVPATRYTILTAAGGVNGQYSGLSQANLPYLDLSLVYDANHVYLDIARNTVDFSALGMTPNEIATADAIETLSPDSALYLAVANLPDTQAARAAFNSLSGEIHASLLSALVEDSRHLREAILDRLSTPAPEQAEGINLWIHGFDSWGQLDSNGNAAQLDSHSRGLFFGADTSPFNPWRAGLVAGLGRSDYDVDARQSMVDSNNTYVAAYAGGRYAKLALRCGAGWTWHNLDTQRQIAFPGVSQRQDSSNAGHTAQAFAELGYTLIDGKHHLEPIAQITYVDAKSKPFYEQGNSITALSGRQVSDNVFYPTLGARANTLLWQTENQEYRARGLLGWRHATNQITPQAMFAFAASDPFLIGGVPIAQDSLMINLGLNASLTRYHLNLNLAYSGQIATNVQDHGVLGRLSYQFS